MDWETDILDKANTILQDYRDTPKWNDVVAFVDESGVDYMDWTDLQMISYYLKNKQDKQASKESDMRDILSDNGIDIIDTVRGGADWYNGAFQIQRGNENYTGLFVTEGDYDDWYLIDRKEYEDKNEEGYDDLELAKVEIDVDDTGKIIVDNILNEFIDSIKLAIEQ